MESLPFRPKSKIREFLGERLITISAWSALIAPHQLTSTATCTEPTRLIVVPADALEAVFERAPQAGAVFMKRLAEVIAQRLRHRTDKLIESWKQGFEKNQTPQKLQRALVFCTMGCKITRKGGVFVEVSAMVF